MAAAAQRQQTNEMTDGLMEWRRTNGQMQQQQATAIDALGTRGVAPSSDIALNCAVMAEYCQDNTYRAYMQRCCATTCGNAGQQTCADRLGHLCPIWNARSSFCQSQFYPNTVKADLCAFTCSLCDLRQQELQLGISSNGARGPIELNCQQLLQGAGGGANHGELVPPVEAQTVMGGTAGGPPAGQMQPMAPAQMQPMMAPQAQQMRRT
ncbi:hypothetical protein niasHT_013749 [Heterodera trifolii]|uniref:ShKT domain-containing protein n=1 Tax=Heterodera trifolii TaxID=157864 RepID=A0ABD2LC14_9BILA